MEKAVEITPAFSLPNIRVTRNSISVDCSALRMLKTVCQIWEDRWAFPSGQNNILFRNELPLFVTVSSFFLIPRGDQSREIP